MYRGSSGQARSHLPRSFKFGVIRLDQPYPASGNAGQPPLKCASSQPAKQRLTRDAEQRSRFVDGCLTGPALHLIRKFHA